MEHIICNYNATLMRSVTFTELTINPSIVFCFLVFYYF